MTERERGDAVVVTGCGNGIGRAIAVRLHADGWKVVGIELNAERAATLEHELTGVTVVVGDVTDRSVLEQAGSRANEIGRLGGWVSNAGLGWDNPLHSAPPEEVDRTLGVNLHAVYWSAWVAVRSFLDHHVAGVIVNMSSIQGRAAFPDNGAYAASKGGVDAFTRYVAVEYGAQGIRCNAIAPGYILTEEAEKAFAATGDYERAWRQGAELHPLKRMGETREVAALVAFLLSDDAAFISGQSIAIDGGATARCYPHLTTPDYA